MPEVAEAGEPDPAVGEHAAGLVRVEGRLRERVGPVVHGEGEEPAGERQGRGRVDHRLPVEAAEAVDEVRGGGPEGQGSDEHAERRPAATPEPRGHELERRRVDAGEEEPGGEAKRDGGPGAGDGSEERVRPGGAQGASEHHDPGGDHVCDVEDAGDERARHEAELHCDRQPRG